MLRVYMEIITGLAGRTAERYGDPGGGVVDMPNSLINHKSMKLKILTISYRPSCPCGEN